MARLSELPCIFCTAYLGVGCSGLIQWFCFWIICEYVIPSFRQKVCYMSKSEVLVSNFLQVCKSMCNDRLALPCRVPDLYKLMTSAVFYCLTMVCGLQRELSVHFKLLFFQWTWIKILYLSIPSNVYALFFLSTETIWSIHSHSHQEDFCIYILWTPGTTVFDSQEFKLCKRCLPSLLSNPLNLNCELYSKE